MLSAIWKFAMTHRSICLPDFPAVSHVRRYSRQVLGSVLLAPDLFVLPAFSSGDFFLTLSHPDADMREFKSMLRQDGKLRGSPPGSKAGRNAGLVRLQDADSLALMKSLRKPYPGLVRINQAGDGIVGVLGRVNVFSILQEASKDDWRAAAEWLRLGHRAEY
jgi:hypothetical protein